MLLVISDGEVPVELSAVIVIRCNLSSTVKVILPFSSYHIYEYQ